MIRLTKKQIDDKVDFIYDYLKASNAAEGSKLDANANVSAKNIATLSAELNKDIFIQINRRLIYNKIEEIWGLKIADEYIRQLEEHEIYAHDESALMPYCVSISMYPFVLNGLQGLGGESKAPKHLSSYNGGFINLVFAIASQFAGAVATVEWLLFFDYFARKEYGDNYLETNLKEITQEIQQVVYALNQPALARNYQCVRADTTQLATPTGFKYLHELKEGDLCYVWKNGTIAIEPILKLNTHDFNGELVQFKGRNYQQTVTDNHRVLYKVPNSNVYNIKEACNLIGHSKLSLPIGSDGIDKEDYDISDTTLKLLVAILTNGTIVETYNDAKKIRIYKSKNRYGYIEIQEWLAELSINYTLRENKTNEFGEMVIFDILPVAASELVNYLNGTKKRIPSFFNKLSSRQAKLVINTWSLFDGSRGENNTQFLQCDNEEIRQSLQELAILAGYGSELYDRRGTKFNSDKECIMTYLKIFKRSDKRVSEYNRIPYKGTVWCPTTKAGVVIFREENGIPYITGNSCFWNISVFDKPYFDAMFNNFVYPDLTPANWETYDKLQKYFMKWFNKERTKAILTFPVVTAACLNNGETLIDKEFHDFISQELSEGNSFFIFTSPNAYALSSCCRLKNDISDQVNDFSYSLGAGGVMTGSLNVITINMNRLIQNWTKEFMETYPTYKSPKELKNECIPLIAYLIREIDKIHKYQVAVKRLYKEYLTAGMLPVYTNNFIAMDKQYLTLGINGLMEGAEFLGYTPSNNLEYKEFIATILEVFSIRNKLAKELYNTKFNTEFVPAENLGVKFAMWDRKAKYIAPRDCYNSYLYPVESNDITILDKLSIHGKDTSRYLDGGSAVHLNLESYPSKEAFDKLIDVAVKEGCEYFCFNIKITICETCGHIDKRTLSECSECHSTNISYATRVIGYLKKVKDFSPARQNEEHLRNYHIEVRDA